MTAPAAQLQGPTAKGGTELGRECHPAGRGGGSAQREALGHLCPPSLACSLPLFLSLSFLLIEEGVGGGPSPQTWTGDLSGLR